MIKIGLIDYTPQNKIIEVKDKNDQLKAQYAISATDILKCSLMKEHYIELSFVYNKSISFKRSDYILWDGLKYTLRNDCTPEQINKRKYKYTLKFEAVEMLFQDIQYYYLNQGLKEAEWRLAGNAEYFIQIAIDNINRYFENTDIKIGTIEPLGIKDITFSTDTNTFDALTQIADEYNAEWILIDNTLNLLNKISYGDEIDFESEVSVLSMDRSEGEDTTRYTRILAFGSTRNIPRNYRQTSTNEAVDAIYSKRLRIPIDKGDVIDAYPNMSPDEVVEGTVIFDDIYPKRVGTIESVGTIEYKDTDEETNEVTKWNAYKFKDSGLNFKEEYVLAGEELRLQFTSGNLNGMDFALKFHKNGFSDTDNSQYFEIVRNEDYGKALPNDILKPSVGDEYALYGFDIALVSDQYVPEGEQELYNKAVEWLKDQLEDRSVYECPTVIKHFIDHQMDLEIGQKVKLIFDDENRTVRSSRIMGFEKKLNNKYDAVYTVGDNASYSRFESIEKEIKELQIAGVSYSNNGRGSVYVIKQFDSTRPTDFNVYSAKATDAKYFNKQTGGTIQGDTVFQKNVQIQGIAISDVFQNSTFTAGQFGSGFQLKRDANGQSYLEIDNLMVRRETVFNKLTIAEIKSIGGTILLSLANMAVMEVEDTATSWKCLFDTANNTIPNDFAIGDQVICRKYTGQDIKYYWALVTAVGADYIELSKTDKDGLGVPSVGDELIQFGNRSDVNRQYAIMLSAYGSDAPSIKQYTGINSYDLTNKEVTSISPKGNKFTGSFIVSSNGTSKPIYKEVGLFVNGDTYYLNDRVSYLGSYWVCVVDSTIKVPNEESTDWRKDTIGQTDLDHVQEEYNAQFLILDTKIASKVSKTDFDELGNRVSDTESSITQLADKITTVVSSVDQVNNSIVDIFSDNKLTPSEKKSLQLEWHAISTEYSKNITEAKKFNISSDSYTSAYNTLSNYITPLLSNLNTTSDVVGGTMRGYFKNYYNTRSTLLNGLTSEAKNLADTAQNTADSKNKTYSQDTIPTAPSGGHKIGDLWYKTSLVDSSGNINTDTTKNIYQLQYRWDGTTWQQINWSASKSTIEQTDSNIKMLVEKTGVDNLGNGESLYSSFNQTAKDIKFEVSESRKSGRNLITGTTSRFNIVGENKDNQSIVIGRFSDYAKSSAKDYISISFDYDFTGITGIVRLFIATSYECIYTFDFSKDPYKGRLTLENVKVWDITWSKLTTLYIRLDNVPTSFSGYVQNPMVEFGSKCTYYTIAPEDVTSGIDKAQTTADGKASIEEVKAGLTIEADGVTIFGEKFTVDSLLIAKAIETQALTVGGNTTIDTDGTISICNGKILLKSDGSGQLANGNISWDKDGNSTVKGKIESNINGNRIVIDPSDRSIKMIDANNNIVLGMSFELQSGNWLSSIITLNHYVDGILMRTSHIKPYEIRIEDHRQKRTAYFSSDEIGFFNSEDPSDITFSAQKILHSRLGKYILQLDLTGIPFITTAKELEYLTTGQVYATTVSGLKVLGIK